MTTTAFDDQFSPDPNIRNGVLTDEQKHKFVNDILDCDTDHLVHLYETVEDIEQAVLAKAQTVPAVSAWEPIDTAPADGNCLVAVETDDGWWVGQLERDSYGNWIHEGEPTYCHGYYFKPTHWMPLPAPPSTQQAVSQDAVDAARYRWLRNDCLKASSGVYGVLAPVVFNTDDCFNHSDEALMGEALDKEIDAARSRVEGES